MLFNSSCGIMLFAQSKEPLMDLNMTFIPSQLELKNVSRDG